MMYVAPLGASMNIGLVCESLQPERITSLLDHVDNLPEIPSIGITLSVHLPDRYQLTSIQHVNWRGSNLPTWVVCVRVVVPDLVISDDYGIGESNDLNEAARSAILDAERRMTNKVAPTGNLVRPTIAQKVKREVVAPAIDTSNLDLSL